MFQFTWYILSIIIPSSTFMYTLPDTFMNSGGNSFTFRTSIITSDVPFRALDLSMSSNAITINLCDFLLSKSNDLTSVNAPIKKKLKDK